MRSQENICLQKDKSQSKIHEFLRKGKRDEEFNKKMQRMKDSRVSQEQKMNRKIAKNKQFFEEQLDQKIQSSNKQKYAYEILQQKYVKMQKDND